MAYETLDFEKNGRLATLTLNRPAAMNSMNEVLMKELADCFEALNDEAEVQVLIIKGAGKVFSAGGDIKAMLDDESPMEIDAVMVDITRFVKAMYMLPMVTIAAVHGASAGLGFSLALGCDIIIAEENSKLAMNFIGIGLIPDGAGHFFMKERLGTPLAKQMIWSGDILTGTAAKKIGLVDEVVPDGKAADQANLLAQKLLQSPIAAMIATKEILHTQKCAELSNVLKMETVAQSKMRKTVDHLEGIQAFVQKRTPAFNGQ
ncbi:enoyl-CoA hydratase [Viridibacillus sp. YIM B01967]|uniref:Enoyl-CoA hydratase n=1 Tax=Viridibacillus soli TaxID=2798301 RepID=A0ABS1H950_9BACL|nr:enoyl-CoA hydratase [Viridibacillus soli]MBK3495947.1 enoyl-CoA hydratase [Viridibacillus soli]